jgi:3-hydroxyacyl-[acyl-carrier-protein] dehydratase
MKKSFTPHGPGFSFVDSFTWEEAGRSLRTKKWLDAQLPFFADHFPGQPLMPGVLLIESAAQAAGVLWGELLKSTDQKHFMLAQVVSFKIQRSVWPDQTIEILVCLEKDFGSLAQFSVEIFEQTQSIGVGRIVLAQAISVVAIKMDG